MKRVPISPRPNWQEQVARDGLLFHTNHDGTSYWNESACYEFSQVEIESLRRAAEELHPMFLQACEVAIRDQRLPELGIPKSLHALVHQSWEADDWEFYGRFDFALADGVPRLLEYNADTPSSLLEASVIQWNWKQQVCYHHDQFNRLHEALRDRWKSLADRGQLDRSRPLYFASMRDHVEDRMTVGYLGETAQQAGFTVPYIAMQDIGWNGEKSRFVDEAEQAIAQIFKLYPWEWMGVEAFAPHLEQVNWRVIEPPWKVVCASKGLLLILQELFPGHPNLLPVSREPMSGSSVRKPIFGREGRNIEIIDHGKVQHHTDGNYGEEGFIYQTRTPLYQDGPYYAQAGVWMVGPEACGLGVREDVRPILGNGSCFVPHVIR